MTPEGLDPTPKLDRPVGSLPVHAPAGGEAEPSPQAGQAGVDLARQVGIAKAVRGVAAPTTSATARCATRFSSSVT